MLLTLCAHGCVFARMCIYVCVYIYMYVCV
jgi:hypothetical protein